MANSLFKGLALTLGGGLAVGLGMKISQTSTPQRAHEGVDLGPVLERIEGVENHIVSVESSHARLAASIENGRILNPSVQELEERVKVQDSEVEALRAAIQRATETHEVRIADLSTTVGNLQSKLPELIDQSIRPKFEEMNGRIRCEMQETATRTLEAFADGIQASLVERIASIETDLNRQSETMKDLHGCSLRNDRSLQALLAGVENLSEKINHKTDAPVVLAKPATSPRMVAEQRAATPVDSSSKPEIKTLLAQRLQRNVFSKVAMVGGLALFAIAGGSDFSSFLHKSPTVHSRVHRAER
jgi:hypothetical protein